jgi:hypothetical protein
MHADTRLGRTLVMLAALHAVACAAVSEETEEGAGGSGEIPVASQSHAIQYCGKSDIYELWGTQTGIYSLRPTSTHLCWLTGLVGGGSHVLHDEVYHWNGGWWLLEHWTGGGAAGAACAPRSCFYSNHPGYDVNWLSGDFRLAGSGSGSMAMWWGDAASIWQGLSSGVMANSHFNSVVQNPVTYESSVLSFYSPPNVSHITWGTSFFVGIPGGAHTPNFPVLRYLSKQNGCTESALMNVDEGVCFFRYAEGDFWGGAESIRLFTRHNPVSGKWEWIQKVCGGSTKKIASLVACYAFNQSV